MEAVAALRIGRHVGGCALRPGRSLIGAKEHAKRIVDAGPGALERRVDHLDATRVGRTSRWRQRHDDFAEAARRRPDRRGHHRCAAGQNRGPGRAAVGGGEGASAGDAGVEDAGIGRRGRIEHQRPRVAASVRAGRPVLAAVTRDPDATARGTVEPVAVGRVDDDDVDVDIEEGRQGVAGVAGRKARAELDPAAAAVGRLEQALRGVGRVEEGRVDVAEQQPLAGAGVDDVRVVRVDREAAWFTDADGQLPVEQRHPGQARIARAPGAAGRRADVEDVRIVWIDRDRADEAVVPRCAFGDRARPDGNPDGAIEAHGTSSLVPPWAGAGGATLAASPRSVADVAIAPGNCRHCARARA